MTPEDAASLAAAGFEPSRVIAEHERLVIDRGGVHVQILGQTGMRGAWYGVIRRDGVRRALRGPNAGLRRFKTARTAVEALEREAAGEPEVLGPFCPEHGVEAARRIARNRG